MSQTAPTSEDPRYPSSDGRPMAENEWQLVAILDAIQVLRARYRERPDVYACGDMLIYYEEGDPSKAVAPDAFVVFGAPSHMRMVYKLWEEPKAPDFVLEVASPGTWTRDAGFKRTLYEGLGVQEYWRFDPCGGLFDPRLQGLTLETGRYRDVPGRLAHGRRVWPSAVLGLDLRPQEAVVRFSEPASGADLEGFDEMAAARFAAEERARGLAAQLRTLGIEPEA